MLWRKLTNAIIEKVLLFKKGAILRVTNDDGTTSDASIADLAIVSGLTATAAELNTMAGILATTAEINRVADSSTRVVASTATTITVSATAHGSKVVLVNATAAAAINLPVASGTGEIYTFIIGVDATATAHVIAANGTDVITGVSVLATTATGEVTGFATSATSDKITLNGTTQGGAKGDKIVCIDVAPNIFQVSIIGRATGTVATPFAAT